MRVTTVRCWVQPNTSSKRFCECGGDECRFVWVERLPSQSRPPPTAALEPGQRGAYKRAPSPPPGHLDHSLFIVIQTLAGGALEPRRRGDF
jgi:hypothetical protein